AEPFALDSSHRTELVLSVSRCGG
ncbi:MAG: hypothetical protein QOF26_3099, partial [Baekduia sp.]|nr:hypothetical protein [Baekduia sp.]